MSKSKVKKSKNFNNSQKDQLKEAMPIVVKSIFSTSVIFLVMFCLECLSIHYGYLIITVIVAIFLFSITLPFFKKLINFNKDDRATTLLFIWLGCLAYLNVHALIFLAIIFGSFNITIFYTLYIFVIIVGLFTINLAGLLLVPKLMKETKILSPLAIKIELIKCIFISIIIVILIFLIFPKLILLSGYSDLSQLLQLLFWKKNSGIIYMIILFLVVTCILYAKQLEKIQERREMINTCVFCVNSCWINVIYDFF